MNNFEKFTFLFFICFTIALSGCYQTRQGIKDRFVSPCKRFGVGTVCFHNPQKSDVKISIQDSKMDIQSYTTICVDMYEGDYELGVKPEKGDKWKDVVMVERCKQQTVALSQGK